MQAAEEVPEHEEEDGSEQEAEKEEEQKFAHMALVEPVDLPTGKSEKIMKLKEKILHFKKAAQRKVIWQLTVIITLLKDWLFLDFRGCTIYFLQVFFLQAHLQVCLTSKVMTTVKLIVEPATEDQLTDLFVASFMADYKDEKSLCLQHLSRWNSLLFMACFRNASHQWCSPQLIFNQGRSITQERKHTVHLCWDTSSTARSAQKLLPLLTCGLRLWRTTGWTSCSMPSCSLAHSPFLQGTYIMQNDLLTTNTNPVCWKCRWCTDMEWIRCILHEWWRATRKGPHVFFS